MKNILLIAPKSINKNSSELSILKTPLSGLLVLATMLRNKRHNVRFIDESFKVPDYDEVDNLDLVLISSMSTTVNRAYTLADMFRNRGIKVILGGVHVSFMANEALNHCDQVVIGEAEDIIFDLVEGKFKSKIVRGLPTENLSRYPDRQEISENLLCLFEGFFLNPGVKCGLWQRAFCSCLLRYSRSPVAL